MTLYRTYRPHRFGDLIGQKAASQTLQQALLQGRVSHAYLFTGPRGTGKTSTARIFAQAVSCLAPAKTKDGYEPCGICAPCLLLAEGRCPDLLEIDAASNRGIEDIRELREQIQYPPLQLSRKIYIIDEVHMLTGEAFNALLKTLEEPPEHCLFILATTELHKVPVTIRSRCQAIRFERGSVEAIASKLERIATHEKLELEKGVPQLIALHADGGYRDAETLLESLSTQHAPLTLAAAQASLGVVAQATVSALVAAMLSQDKRTTVKVLRESFSTPDGSLERVIAQLIEEVRRLLFQAEPGYPLPLLGHALSQLLEAYILQKSSPLPGLPLEIACLNICDYASAGQPVALPVPAAPAAPRPQPSAPAVLERAPKAEEKPPAPVAVVAVPTPQAAPVSSVPVIELREETITDLRRAWREMIDVICRENIVLGQALKDTVFHKAEEGAITIHVRFKFHADKMAEKKNRSRINGIMRDLTGQDWDITYVITALAPKRAVAKNLGDGLADAAAVFGQPNAAA